MKTFGKIITTTFIATSVFTGINHSYVVTSPDKDLAPIAQGMNLAHDKLSGAGQALADGVQQKAVDVESSMIDAEINNAQAAKQVVTQNMTPTQYINQFQSASPLINIRNMVNDEMMDNVAQTAHSLITTN